MKSDTQDVSGMYNLQPTKPYAVQQPRVVDCDRCLTFHVADPSRPQKQED